MAGPAFTQLHGAGGRFTEGNQGVVWTGLQAMANNINRRGKTLNQSRKRAMELLALEMQNYMKANAPWHDQTGNARDRLHTVVLHSDAAATSTVWASHGVSYGLHLETMRGGQLAIIMPTIEKFQGRVMGKIIELDTAEEAFGRVYHSS